MLIAKPNEHEMRDISKPDLEFFVGSVGSVDIYACVFDNQYSTAEYNPTTKKWDESAWRANYTERDIKNYNPYISATLDDPTKGYPNYTKEWSLAKVVFVAYVNGIETNSTLGVDAVEFGFSPEANLLGLGELVWVSAENAVKALVPDFETSLFHLLPANALKEIRTLIGDLEKVVS
jgi:hypothetical protein